MWNRTLEYSTSENGQNGQKMGVYWNNELIGSAFGANAWAAKRNAAASTLKQLKAQHWGGKRGGRRSAGAAHNRRSGSVASMESVGT